MVDIEEYNGNFELDIKELVAQDVLKDKLINELQLVKFHLETAWFAFEYEWSRRYLPKADMYLDGINKRDTAKFMKLFSCYQIETTMKTLQEHVKTRKNWIRSSARKLKINETKFQKLLHFTTFSCDLKLTDYSFKFDSGVKVFVIKCSPKKEKQFHSLRGKTSYLFHRTRRQSIYSIFRNGIQTMSKTRFEVSGHTHGSGIYLGPAGWDPGYGHISLCYAIKNEDRFRTSDARPIYKATNKDICLRAIVWKPMGWIHNYDQKIIECIVDHYGQPNQVYAFSRQA